MDKISDLVRCSTVNIKDYCKKVEEEMFNDLIATKDTYLNIFDGTDDRFREKAFEDYSKASIRIYTLFELELISAEERSKIVRALYNSYISYVDSKEKEVK